MESGSLKEIDGKENFSHCAQFERLLFIFVHAIKECMSVSLLVEKFQTQKLSTSRLCKPTGHSWADHFNEHQFEPKFMCKTRVATTEQTNG